MQIRTFRQLFQIFSWNEERRGEFLDEQTMIYRDKNIAITHINVGFKVRVIRPSGNRRHIPESSCSREPQAMHHTIWRIKEVGLPRAVCRWEVLLSTTV